MIERYLVGLNDEDESLELRREESGEIFVRVGEKGLWKSAKLESIGETGLSLLMIDNMPTELYVDRRRGGAVVTIGRHTFDCDVGPWRPPSARASQNAANAGRREVKAPMTGGIVEVRVEAGQVVEQGDVLLVIESMKMNNELRAPVGGTIADVKVKAGQRVQQNALLISIEV